MTVDEKDLCLWPLGVATPLSYKLCGMNFCAATYDDNNKESNSETDMAGTKLNELN